MKNLIIVNGVWASYYDSYCSCRVVVLEGALHGLDGALGTLETKGSKLTKLQVHPCHYGFNSRAADFTLGSLVATVPLEAG